MENNIEIPRCRQCPSSQFDLVPISKNRFMAICHAKEGVFEPIFADVKERFISKATLPTVNFQPLENCPHIEKLRTDGLLPWATTIADFNK